MPDPGMTDSLADKFQQWACGLSGEEQTALAGWITRGQEVQGYTQESWWQGEGAWSAAWKDSWNW